MALGAWMDRRGNRSDVFILSKGGHPNADRNRRVTVFDIASDLFDSLARLRTDYIDLYLLHRDDPEVPVGPLVEALNEHMSEGTHPRVRRVQLVGEPDPRGKSRMRGTTA